MLVLSRKRQERILIGADIEVTVLSVQGRRVRLGINCPAEKRILRAEVMPEVNFASIPKYSLETAIHELSSDLNAPNLGFFRDPPTKIPDSQDGVLYAVPSDQSFPQTAFSKGHSL
jgi:carbon storage regulator